MNLQKAVNLSDMLYPCKYNAFLAKMKKEKCFLSIANDSMQFYCLCHCDFHQVSLGEVSLEISSDSDA